MDYDTLIGHGLLALFGGLPLWALVGWLVARASSFENGAGSALVLFGATGLAAAGALAWFVFQHPGFAETLDDPRQPCAMVGVFGAFGGFGALGGAVLLAWAARERRERSGRPGHSREEVPVSAERERWGQSFTIAGNVAIFGCAAGAGFTDLSAERGIELTFTGVVAGCACFLVAFACKGKLTLEAGLILVLVGGGFALAVAAVRYLT